MRCISKMSGREASRSFLWHLFGRQMLQVFFGIFLPVSIFPGEPADTISGCHMVSKEYSPGIMTNPVRLMTDNDMMDMDWNVSRGIRFLSIRG